MTEKELLEQLNQLKQIKPNENWASWLLSNILSQTSLTSLSEVKQSQKPKIHLVAFAFLRQYQKALVSLAFALLFTTSFALAQKSLPDNPLYPLKTFTQNIRIALAPTDYKPLVRMQVAKSRLEDLAKIQQKEKLASVVTQKVAEDLKIIPQELKNIQNKNKVLTYSQKIQKETENLNKIINQTPLQVSDKEILEKTNQETQNQVLSLIIDTQDQINNCPTYLKNKLSQLQNDFGGKENLLLQWPPDDIKKIRVLVSEIDNDLKAGNCLEAMEKIESINQILQIHSLDIKVETSTPGN